MDISTAIIILLVVLLYLAISFVVAIVHYLGSNQEITGLKRVFLLPAEIVLAAAKRF